MVDPTGEPAPPVSDRRQQLLAVKLRALVGDHLGEPPPAGDVGAYSPGAAALVGDDAWVLVDDRPRRQLGSALAWARRRGATRLHLITEADGGVLARRAAAFAYPVTVWTVAGRRLVGATPEPLTPPPPADPVHLAQRELIAAGGATPVVEHGVVAGEVRGLEVCRVVSDPAAPAGARLEIGVGAHDREAFQMLHGDTPTAESLARVVDAVRAHRVPGAPRHPFNRMAAERLLRWQLEDSPDLIELDEVVAAQPPVARASVVEAVPCVAHGTDRAGRSVVVVCSSGVDLDVVPFAVDARLAAEAVGLVATDARAAPANGTAPGIDRLVVDRLVVDRLVVVTPRRDRLGVTVELAALAAQSVELASID